MRRRLLDRGPLAYFLGGQPSPDLNCASVARKSGRVACVLVKRGDYLIDLFARRQTFCYYSIGDSFHAQGAEQLHVAVEVRWMRNTHTADGNPSSNE